MIALALAVPTLVTALQMAIGPVIMISGIGLLQLSLTNRLGRCIDRARVIGREQKKEPFSAVLGMQLKIIDKRATLLQKAIIHAVLAILTCAALVLTMFASAFYPGLAWLIGLLFCSTVLSLIGSNVFFLREITLALDAMRHDAGIVSK